MDRTSPLRAAVGDGVTVRWRIFTAVSILVLAGWLAAAGVWVRSYWVENVAVRVHSAFAERAWTQRTESISLRRGKVYWSVVDRRSDLPESFTRRRPRGSRDGARTGPSWSLGEVRPPPKWGYRGRWGFTYRSNIQTANTPRGALTVRNVMVMFPWGLTMAVLGVVPVWWLVALRRRLRQVKRRKAGLCVECGYDLRASTERCPECGATAAA